MTDSTRTAATGALEELLDVSPQVEAAIVASHDGTLVASSLGGRGGAGTPDRLAQVVVRLLKQADSARSELGREAITQLEVATGNGTVFVVRDANHVVAAITGNEPTVGLVFYDLKTALRTVREDSQTAGSASADTASNNGHSPNGKTKSGPTKGAKS